MKNIVLSAVAVIAMSSFATAGGNVAPILEPVVVPEPVITDSGFYIGLAYGLLNFEQTGTRTDRYGTYQIDDADHDFNEIMLQAGYKFNSYIAIEGRYWFGLDETITDDGEPYDVSVDAWGIYVKPMYPVTDALDIYALLGYASSDFTYSDSSDGDTYDGFSWGIGAAYSFTENLSIFVDYVSLYSDSDSWIENPGFDSETYDVDTDITTWNFGVTYKF